MESGTAEQDRSAIEGGVTQEEVEKLAPPESIEIAAAPGGDQRLSDEDKQDATDWLLADDDDDGAEVYKTLTINVGTPDAPKRIDWTIRAIDPDEMRQIRSRAGSRGGPRGRRQRQAQTGEVDDSFANLLIVTAATVTPNVREVAKQKGIADPSEVVKHRFRKKPGLIDQLAAEIFLFSGWDEEDIQEAKEVRAAGNS